MRRPYLRAPLLMVRAALFCALPLHGPIFAAEHAGIAHTLLFKGKVPGADEQIIVWDTEYAPGAVNPRHLHRAAVTFRVLSGVGIWEEDGKPPVTLHAGESLLAPAGTIHRHWNPSQTETLRFLEFIVASEGDERTVPSNEACVNNSRITGHSRVQAPGPGSSRDAPCSLTEPAVADLMRGGARSAPPNGCLQRGEA
jgi:quercetin dioxygenase-like cupin family protein